MVDSEKRFIGSVIRIEGDASRVWRAAGQSILVVDKYVEKLIELADHHTLIEGGRVVWHGTSAELDADHGIWQRFLGI